MVFHPFTFLSGEAYTTSFHSARCEAVEGPVEGTPLPLAVWDAFSIMLANMVKVIATLFRTLVSVSKV
ncbi:hypothetical protein Tco_0164824 [Tanacetum coccineum]